MSAYSFTTLVNHFTHLIDVIGNKQQAALFVQNSFENLLLRLRENVPPVQIQQVPKPISMIQQINQQFIPSYPILNPKISDNSLDKSWLISQNNLKNSPSYQYLLEKFGPEIHLTFLLKMAEDISFKLKIPLNREIKRKKTLLIKWFEDYWSIIFPIIDNYKK